MGGMIPAYPSQAVRAAEQRAVEAAEATGGEDALMTVAAGSVARAALSMTDSEATVVALVGGGDNGGDALYAAASLARQGRSVRAALLSDHPHGRALAAARAAGVEVRELPLPVGGPGESLPDWLVADLWIDGITGAGLSGALREPLAGAVTALDALARSFGTAVLAVDVPTGIGAPQGRVDGPVLRAVRTVTMGAAKTSLLVPPGAAYCGDVEVTDLGVHPEVDPEVLRPEAADVGAILRVPGPFDHKYTRGVVVIAAGSDTFPGAGVLCASGAAATGPGMVRLASSRTVVNLVLARHPGVVAAPGRAQAAVVGSGLDSDVESTARSVMRQALEADNPVVIDAGALSFLEEMVREARPLRRAVLTPHAGEAASVLTEIGGRPVSREEVEARPLDAARRLSELTGANVVLKGSVTLIVGAHGRAFSVAGGTGWSGVAGSGDVLAGILGAVLAQRRSIEQATGEDMDFPAIAAAAVWIHDRAATLAAGVTSARAGSATVPGAPIQPEDIADAVPAAIAEALLAADKRSRAHRQAVWTASAGH